MQTRNWPRWLRWAGVALAAYVGFVVLFETVYLGWFQPKLEGMPIPMLVLTTTDAEGTPRARRLARLDVDEKIYVSAHHWPRAWHRRALAHPRVRVESAGVALDAVAVPVAGEEFERVATAYPLPLLVRFLMGFPPPREILRLDPR